MKRVMPYLGVAVLALFLAVPMTAGEAEAHGPRGGFYLSSGGFSFGSGSYGGAFFGFDSGSGLSFWVGAPGRIHFHRPGHYGHRPWRGGAYGPLRRGGIIILDVDRGRPHHGPYGLGYGEAWRQGEFRSRRVWVPGRSTPGGYVQGRWELRPLRSGGAE